MNRRGFLRGIGGAVAALTIAPAVTLERLAEAGAPVAPVETFESLGELIRRIYVEGMLPYIRAQSSVATFFANMPQATIGKRLVFAVDLSCRQSAA